MSSSRVTRSQTFCLVDSDDDDTSDDDDDDVPMPPKRCRVPQRNWNCCEDVKGLPDELCCSGCKLVKDSSSNKPRAEHTSAKCECCQAWRQKEWKPSMDHHVTRVQAWIKEHESIDCEAAFDAPATMSPRMLDSLPPTTTPKANIVIEPKLVTISSEPKRQLNFWEQSISSNCRKSTCEMPTSHKLALISHLKKSKNNNKTLQNAKAKLQSSSCTSHTYMSQALWAILMSSVPTRAFSTAQHAFPLMMWAHLCDAGMFENDFELEHCAAAFPSDWTLRRLMFHQAARDTILLGDQSQKQTNRSVM